MKRSIAFLVNSLGTGGAEIQVAEMAVRLWRRGWSVGVITLIEADQEAARFDGSGIVHHWVGMRRGIADPRAVRRLAGVLKQWNPTVLHSHMIHSNLLARVTRILVRVPVLVTTVHSVNEGARWRYWAYGLTARMSDLVTVISNAVARQHLDRCATPRGKLRVVPNGIDISRFLPEGADLTRLRRSSNGGPGFIWLAVGRFEECKDYPTLLTAFATLQGRWPGAILRIAGGGPLLAETEAMAARLGLSGRVQFLGVRRDVPLLMQSVDAFVMSSAWEGLPLVLLEAAASGLPVVATDVGGNRDVILHGRSGALVQARMPEAIAHAMDGIMSMTAAEREAMGRVGRDHVKARFDIEHRVDEWERIYHELFANALRARGDAR